MIKRNDKTILSDEINVKISHLHKFGYIYHS